LSPPPRVTTPDSLFVIVALAVGVWTNALSTAESSVVSMSHCVAPEQSRVVFVVSVSIAHFHVAPSSVHAFFTRWMEIGLPDWPQLYPFDEIVSFNVEVPSTSVAIAAESNRTSVW
jgi:hypothetical protein